MTKQLKKAGQMSELLSSFRCPICHSELRVVDIKSLVCGKKHTFDFAKQGYLNFMTRPVSSPYTKSLFEARHRIITETGLFTALHETVAEVVMEHSDASTHRFTMADLGCGEGSHLQMIIDGCQDRTITGIGLDLSKEAVLMASKRHESPIWLVGDLAKTPFNDQSMDALLTILSPSNYSECKRILARGGLVMKVVPRAHYLRELREALFPNSNKPVYRNTETVTLFKQHFQLLDVVPVKYTRKLSRGTLDSLVHMTPLSWSADSNRVTAFINQEEAEITVDLEVLVGCNQ
ncbi:methyltransferase domain-containing protein [Paenibacillus sp. H1-7]|uniref:putative RNA methyltransferase n=1 Tax=Paenibacillus sp. H1-7 TaxID=2282849 RepID=UPI001EF98180|nr:methyltransferase domain-containing protein [Paenibacillus sp. H1-7]ULL16350.1 methyltransferase domain-containing protein [Paenibacillus sp. H1-7]